MQHYWDKTTINIFDSHNNYSTNTLLKKHSMNLKIYKKHLFAVILLILYEITRYNDSEILR